ncbi:SDR family oxidoreductase [Candidatus Peregrinibacteria bacterium HGW-Peregrinibacteria-1]|jgi:2-deoxy-D-gluconate 3-dehydrogenase|nr:MAG: SDR family oxidoreductase [Candidatus Peregrinibacteria bacterium HGW-Peregrinibacteria-1]
MDNLNKLLDLSGKTALITGGSRGIGLGIAYRLAEAGANIVIASQSQEDLDNAVKELSQKNFQVKSIKADVSSENEVKNMIDFTVKSFGSLDILVNNAGIFPSNLVMDMTEAQFEKVIDVNLKGVFLCSKYSAQAMIKQGNGGKIINITSVDALHPSSVGLAHYDASKHGVWGFTKNLALELAPHKIWVNAIAPGAINTPGVQEMQQQTTNKAVDMKKTLEAFMNKVPMRRMGEPDDIGKATLFLASDLASYITGEQIVVDGGMLLS